MRNFIFLLLLSGCFSIEEVIWIKRSENYDLLYRIEMSSFITQMISEDSIREKFQDERAKYIKIETDSLRGIMILEIFYEDLSLNELISKDSSLKFYKSKDYIEFYKLFSLGDKPSDTLTENLMNFLFEENYYKLVVISEKEFLKSNADSISSNRLVWVFPLRKLYQLEQGDTIKVFFRLKN